ncbi:MAG: peptidoglycan DD-metalloendopeptidase family protein [Candidatus Yanofskybacteria bacterium]|nr:peptidoglycan DD-metalloendopeptidase family protein [Candidatus Yanofskybacteria bacterium]
MKFFIILLATLTIISNTDVPSRSFDTSAYQQALSWRSFNLFRRQRQKPALPVRSPIPVFSNTPAPIRTPEHRPVNMPKSREVVTPTPSSTPTGKWLMFPRTTDMPTASPALTPRASHEPAQNNLNQKFRTLEDEVMGVKQKKSLFSTDHANRILRDLNDLENNGYSKVETEKLRQIVYEFTPDLKKQSGFTTTDQNCIKANPVLVADITDTSKIQKITAPGTASSEGPKGHSFIWTNSVKVPVYAPTDIILDSGSYVKDNENAPAQYILWFLVKGYCDFQVKFDHIDEPIEAVRKNFSSIPKVADSRGTQVADKVELRAGELLGYTKGNIPSGNWDFGMYDMSKEGPLAQYGSQASHRNAVCWPDFYSSGKREFYKRLLEGPRLLCSFSSSSEPQTQPSPATSSNNPPVIKNLGINFDTAFVFLQSENKLFLEYGAEVSGPSGPKILPTFEYRTAPDADVLAISDGIVQKVTYQNDTSDYEIHIIPSENSQWTIGHDHVNNPKVSVGNRVKAGDIIGKAGNMGGGLGRTEIMIWVSEATRPMTYCPLKYFDPQLLDQYKQKIIKHMKDWEDFKGNSNLYNEQKHILPGCAYEKIAD